jgi:hypothetical protein
MIAFLLLGCTNVELPHAIVESDRSGHFLDRPFPSDELRLPEGGVDLSDFPLPEAPLGRGFIEGWTGQAAKTVHGFSPLAPIFFRFDGPLEVQDSYAGKESDPVRLRLLADDSLVPLRVGFVGDPLGDPFLGKNTLMLAPQESTPLQSGGTYRAEVDASIALPPQGANQDRKLAVSTEFTVQDVLGQLQALGRATDDALDGQSANDPGFRKVLSLGYAPGQTPSGEDALVCTVTFEDGTSEDSYLEPSDGVEGFVVDLSDDAMEVWQGTIQTVAFRDAATRPYATPGMLGFAMDSQRTDGWIDFDGDGNLLNTPHFEPMRIVVQVPRAVVATRAMTWDHGTGGHAYNAVHRTLVDDDFLSVRGNLAGAGVVVVSRDQPLYGTRYPLIDEGYSGTLGFYNIGNLPAFRDNQRQAAVDHRVLHRFVRDELPALIEVDSFQGIGAFGHSLGSVTTHLGIALQDGDGADAALLSGTGGIFTYYITDTGLLTGGTGSTASFAQSLFLMLGVGVPDEITGAKAIAALLGVPEEAWDHVNRLHPALGLFQLIMDPSDPMAVAPWSPIPETIVLGVGDLQVPNNTTEWLAEALPDATLIRCEPAGDYDGHYCIYREPVGLDAFREFGEGL